MTARTPLALLTLQRLATKPEPWVADAKCLSSGVDMISVTESKMNEICGSCLVREQCEEGAQIGEPVRAGARGGLWQSRRKQQPQ